MSNDVQAVAAYSEFIVGETTITLAPLTFDDWGALSQWISDKIIITAKQHGLDDGAALRESMNVSILDIMRRGTQGTILSSFEGMLRIVMLSMNGAGEKTDLKKLKKLFENRYFDLGKASDKVLILSIPEGKIIEENKESGESGENPPSPEKG